MNFLSSIVPGIREVRVPLIAGYMWLLFAWLLVQPDLPLKGREGTLGSIVDLSTTAGPLATWAVVSVTAYLIGAITTTVSPVLAFSRDQSRRHAPRLHALTFEEIQETDSTWNSLARGNATANRLDVARACHAARLKTEAYRYGLTRANPVGEALHVVLNDATKVAESLTGAELFELRGAVHRAATRMKDELRLPASLVINDGPQAFAEVDRLRGEGELRLAIVPPMVAIAVVLVATESWLWSVGVVAALILLIQGRRRAARATHVAASAIAYRRAHSPARDDLATYVTEIREAKQFAPSIERAVISILNEETDRLCTVERAKAQRPRWQRVKRFAVRRRS